jgi:hypothetical protein
VLGSLVVLISFFLTWFNFPYYLVFGFTPKPPTESDLRAYFQAGGFPAGDINDLTQLGMMAISGKVTGLNLLQAIDVIKPHLDPKNPTYTYYFKNEAAQQITSLISTVLSLFIIIPLAGLVGLLMLSGTHWSRTLARLCALPAMSLLAIPIFFLFSLQTPDLPVKLSSIIGIGVWGSLAGLAWQFITPLFVKS